VHTGSCGRESEMHVGFDRETCRYETTWHCRWDDNNATMALKETRW